MRIVVKEIRAADELHLASALDGLARTIREIAPIAEPMLLVGASGPSVSYDKNDAVGLIEIEVHP